PPRAAATPTAFRLRRAVHPYRVGSRTHAPARHRTERSTWLAYAQHGGSHRGRRRRPDRPPPIRSDKRRTSRPTGRPRPEPAVHLPADAVHGGRTPRRYTAPPT